MERENVDRKYGLDPFPSEKILNSYRTARVDSLSRSWVIGVVNKSIQFELHIHAVSKGEMNPSSLAT